MRRIAAAIGVLACVFGLLPAAANAAFGPAGSFGGAGNGDGQFNHPQSAAVDSTGRVYVVDAANNRIERFGADGSFQTSFTASGDFSPQDVAIGPGDSIYVSSPNRVDTWSSNLPIHTQFTPSGLGTGYGIAVDSSGNIYVSDVQNSQVREYNPLGGFLNAIGSSGSGAGQMLQPRGLTMDSSNNLYVADPANGRIDKFSSAGASLGQIAMPSYTVQAAGGPYTGLISPQDVAVDGTGRIFAPDTGTHSNLVVVLGLGGTQVFGAPDSDPASVCKVSSPWGVATSPSGTLYVVSTGENLVRMFDESHTTCPTPNFGSGGGINGSGSGGPSGTAGANGNNKPQISFTGFPARKCIRRDFIFQIHLYDADRIARMVILVNRHRVARQTPNEQFWNVKVRMPVRALRHALPPGRSVKIGITVRATDLAGGSSTASRAFRVCT